MLYSKQRKYLHRYHCRCYVLIFAEESFIYRYEKIHKILKTHDHFQNIINVLFLLNLFICKTMLNICTTLDAYFMYLYIYTETNFMYQFEKDDVIKFWKLMIIFKISEKDFKDTEIRLWRLSLYKFLIFRMSLTCWRRICRRS
jgi:hypothetical protein